MRRFEEWVESLEQDVRKDYSANSTSKESNKARSKIYPLFSGTPLSKEFIERYEDGEGFRVLLKEYGIPKTLAETVISNSGIVLRGAPVKAAEAIAILKEHGWSRETFEEYYLHQNLTFNQLHQKLEEEFPGLISERLLGRILPKLNLKKPEELVKINQGAKSKREFAVNLDKLHRAGFSSPKELAKFYEENKITLFGLATTLNKKLEDGEEKFTVRWLERHVIPLVELNYRGRVSRLELEIFDYISFLYMGKIVRSDRTVISPYELDLFFPELFIAIEVNGDYWHSEKFLKENHGLSSEEYHSMKKDKCKKKNIELFFVWESDWVEFREDMESILKKILGRGEKEGLTVEERKMVSRLKSSLDL